MSHVDQPQLEMLPLDPKQLRGALGRYATGVAVVTAIGLGNGQETGPVGLTINSFASVSLDPPLILWSLRNDSPALPAFRAASHFTVNVLAADQRAISDRFARPGDKYANVSWRPGLGGAPVLDGCLASFECARHAELAGGDHVIFLGRVGRFLFTDGDPLLYFAGGYCTASGRS